MIDSLIINALEIHLKDKGNSLHKLKIHPDYFFDIIWGIKTFELRKNDRNYKVGDFLLLTTELGSEVIREIKYIMTGGQYGLDKDYVILSI